VPGCRAEGRGSRSGATEAEAPEPRSRPRPLRPRGKPGPAGHGAGCAVLLPLLSSQASPARTSSRNMFSALKKLVGSEQAPGRDKNIPAGLQSMNQALQRRFAKGVQYNSECGPRRRAGRGGWQGPGRPPSLLGSGRIRG
jgi:hypothetical protein